MLILTNACGRTSGKCFRTIVLQTAVLEVTATAAAAAEASASAAAAAVAAPRPIAVGGQANKVC